MENLNNYNPTFLKEKLIVKENKFNEEEFNILFKELKNFLLIKSMFPTKKVYMINKKIYLLWHEFILYTKEYTNFCNLFFRSYIHHSPNNWSKLNKEGKETSENFFELYQKVFGEIPNGEVWVFDN